MIPHFNTKTKSPMCDQEEILLSNKLENACIVSDVCISKPSKYEQMSNYYSEIAPITGYLLYEDEWGDSFMDDYNKLIHREIKKNNIKAIHSLCSWMYYCDRAFPWYDPMLRLAIEHDNVTEGTMMFVLYMWKYWYEEREESLTLAGAQELTPTDAKNKILLHYMDLEPSDDDADKYEAERERQQDKMERALLEFNINLPEMEREYELVKEMTKGF